MSKRDVNLLQSTLKIERYTKNAEYNLFVADDKIADAVIRNSEIIGEVTNSIDIAFEEDDSKIE